MAVTKVLARGFDFEVDDGLETSSFLAIGGINTFSVSPSKNDAETTDFDSEGWAEHLVASRGLEIELEGYYMEDEEDGTRDEGQERIEEVAELIGAESIVPFRMTTPGGTTIAMNVSVNASPFGTSTGGGNDDPAGWSATLVVSGKPTIE